MISAEQIVNTVKNYFTLKDTFDKSYDATSATLSGSPRRAHSFTVRRMNGEH